MISTTISFAVLLAHLASQPSAPPRIVGLFVAVPETAGAQPLRYAKNDVKLVARMLGGTAGGSRSLVEGQATRGDILREFAAAAARTRPGEILWFHFSGHGISHGRSSFIVPYLRSSKDLLNPNALVPISRLREIARARAAKGARVVLVIDACHSGSARSNTVVANIAQIFGTAPGVATLAATEVDRVAYELPSIEGMYSGGVFTYFLVRGLSGHAAPGGRVTLASLAKYVSEQVERYTRNAYRGTQKPVFLVHPTMASTVIAARASSEASFDPGLFETVEGIDPIAPGFVVYAEAAPGRYADVSGRLQSGIIGKLLNDGVPISADGLSEAEKTFIRRRDAARMEAIVVRRNARYLLVVRTRVIELQHGEDAIVELQATCSLVDGRKRGIVFEENIVRRGVGFDSSQAINGALKLIVDDVCDRLGPFLSPE